MAAQCQARHKQRVAALSSFRVPSRSSPIVIIPPYNVCVCVCVGYTGLDFALPVGRVILKPVNSDTFLFWEFHLNIAFYGFKFPFQREVL